jgi:SpoVK/Ycf46/Vps4 family AAA+-type ATPase
VIKQRVDASETTLIADDLNLNAISSTTEGYAPADLKDLVSRAIHQAAMRVNKTLADGPTKLSLSDFEKRKDLCPRRCEMCPCRSQKSFGRTLGVWLLSWVLSPLLMK